ncbi:MAG: ribosome biogenesis GTPase YlqF, partial [Cetobacterium sp.]
EKMLEMGKKDVLKDKYKLLEEDFEQVTGAIIESIAVRMNMLQKGGNPNVQQATYTVLRDYRACKLGKFGLDMDIAEQIKNLYK